LKYRVLLCGFFFLANLAAMPSFAKRRTPAAKIPLLTVQQFKTLSRKKKKSYVREVSRALLKFEKRYGVQKFANFNPFFWDVASADSTTHCVIGQRVFERSTFDNSCPTTKAPCTLESGGGDPKENFECGPFYGNLCIPRGDITTLSKRCQNGLDLSTLDTNTYSGLVDAYGTVFDDNPNVCSEQESLRSGSGCNLLQKDLLRLNTLYSQAQRAAPQAAQQPVSQPASGQASQQTPAEEASTEQTDTAVSAFGATAASQGSVCPAGAANPLCPNSVVLKKASFANIEFKTDLCGDQGLEFESPDGFKRRIYKDEKGRICQDISKDLESDTDFAEAAKNAGGSQKVKDTCRTTDECIRKSIRKLRSGVRSFLRKHDAKLDGRGFCKGFRSKKCPPKIALKSCNNLRSTRTGENPCRKAVIRRENQTLEGAPDDLLKDLLATVKKKKGDSDQCVQALSKCLNDVEAIKDVARDGVAKKTLCGFKWKFAAGKVKVGPYWAENAVIKDESGKTLAEIKVGNDFNAVTIASKRRRDPAIRIPADSEDFSIQGWSQQEGGVQTGAVSAAKGQSCDAACSAAQDTKTLDLATQTWTIGQGTPACLLEGTSTQRQSSGSGSATQ